MICQRCHKNQATTHLKQTVNGKMHEYYLCSECASELGYGSVMSNNPFNDILAGLFGASRDDITARRCPKCGSTFEDISKHGMVGCAQCYDVFFDKLLPMIQRVHGTSYHKGKKPGTTAIVLAKPVSSDLVVTDNSIEAKKKALKEAVMEQRFEDAAKLRDEIKEMENNE